MSELLNRFSFTTARWNGQIAACLLLVWVVIVLSTISSIRSQGYSPAQRRFWMGVVVLLPLVGLLAYLPFAIRHEDLPTHLTLRTRERKGSKGGRGSNAPTGKG